MFVYWLIIVSVELFLSWFAGDKSFFYIYKYRVYITDNQLFKYMTICQLLCCVKLSAIGLDLADNYAFFCPIPLFFEKICIWYGLCLLYIRMRTMAGTAVPTIRVAQNMPEVRGRAQVLWHTRLVSRLSAYTRLAEYSVMRSVPISSCGDLSHTKKLKGLKI